MIRVVVEYRGCMCCVRLTANYACGDPIISFRVLICLEKYGISFAREYEEILHREWFNVVSIGFNHRQVMSLSFKTQSSSIRELIKKKSGRKWLLASKASTSIWKLRAERAVKLPIRSLYVFPGITVRTKREQSTFEALQTPETKLGVVVRSFEQLNLPLPCIRSD